MTNTSTNINTSIVDATQLFANNEDKELLLEYYNFVAYILDYTTQWVVESSSIRFSKNFYPKSLKKL